MRDNSPDPDPAAQSDDWLLAAYGAGNERAALELTRRLTPRLFGYAFRMLRDRAEAEDVAQEAMLRLWRAAPGWVEGQAKPSTWAHKVVANLAIDRMRKRRTTALDDAGDPADDSPDAVAQMMQTARMTALTDAIAELPERQAIAVSLRHLEGWSNPDIAEALEIGVEAVESLTARAKRKLAEILAGRKEELGYDGG